LRLVSALHLFSLLSMISSFAISDQLASRLNFDKSSPKTHVESANAKFGSLEAPARSLILPPINNIILIGSKRQKRRLTRWLNDIAVVPKSYITLKAIEASGHTLTIKHSIAARLSSGRTIAPMTQKITNGEGDDILIIFDADMDDRGSHRVFGVNNELIEFNAIQNLYHELAHAMHQMKGTWRYFASEKQTIEEENEFRKDLAVINDEPVRLRYRTKGAMINKLASGGIGYRLPE